MCSASLREASLQASNVVRNPALNDIGYAWLNRNGITSSLSYMTVLRLSLFNRTSFQFLFCFLITINTLQQSNTTDDLQPANKETTHNAIHNKLLRECVSTTTLCVTRARPRARELAGANALADSNSVKQQDSASRRGRVRPQKA